MKNLDSLMLKKLDWYIIKKFLGTYFFSISLIVVIIVVFDYNDNIDKFTASNVSFTTLLFDYYLNFIPHYANMFSALFVFIAVIYFTSKLADNSEIIAIFSSGVSFKRFLRPYIVSAAFLSILSYILGAYIIPEGSKKMMEFEIKYKGGKQVDTARNIQMEVDDNTIAYIERYENRNNTAYRFSLDKFEGKTLVSHMTARSIIYNPDEKYKWTAKNWMIRELRDGGEEIRSSVREPLDTIIKLEPADFLITKGMQMTMSSPKLGEYISKQRQRGVANIKEFEIEYHRRIAMSFAAFILTIIGVSLSCKKTRGGMGLSLGLGLLLSFSYILFQTISSTFAQNGNAPVILAVWIPNILYSIIAGVLYVKAKK